MIIIFILLFSTIIYSQQPDYPWLINTVTDSKEKIADIPTPPGFKRISKEKKSFGYWLRNLPIQPKENLVHLYNGKLKSNQSAHYRIINIDVGEKNLQQCADAVIRLRAEFLYNQNKLADIHFNFTSGDAAIFTEWMKGFRPYVKNNKVRWEKRAPVGRGYQIFKSYLETVFIYSGSYSLKKELIKVTNTMDIHIGDVFIQGGFPGHAVIVVDLAKSIEDDKIAVLLAQSYMPAQDIHILKNQKNIESNPWYIVKEHKKLFTPEWTFDWSDLYRFNRIRNK